jgi:hypothetical protein
MTFHFFDAKALANKLADGVVTRNEGFYYLVTSFILSVLGAYSGLMNTNLLWSWMSIYEGLVILVVYWYGFARVYAAAGGDDNPNFIFEFTCLYVPVWLSTTAIGWGVYWITTRIMHESLIALGNSDLQFAMNLSKMGGNFFSLLIFLTAVVTQVVIFLRLTALFEYLEERKRLDLKSATN